jgi:hypothetical protein
MVRAELQRTATTGLSMVILDDIATLEWIGCSGTDLVLFTRALVVLARQVRLVPL